MVGGLGLIGLGMFEQTSKVDPDRCPACHFRTILASEDGLSASSTRHFATIHTSSSIQPLLIL